MVKLMDLGITVPAAVTTGTSVLRHASWARRMMYALLPRYSCLTVSVAAMGVVMNVNGDPDASPGLAVGFEIFAPVFVTLTGALYRPLFCQGVGEQR